MINLKKLVFEKERTDAPEGERDEYVLRFIVYGHAFDIDILETHISEVLSRHIRETLARLEKRKQDLINMGQWNVKGDQI